MRARPHRAYALFALAVLSVPGVAWGGGYEERLEQWALEQSGRVRDPVPEGKTIEDVVVVSENVFSPSDPYPTWLNVFHARTRDHVVRREVLLLAGQPYSQALVDETGRNLRSLFILAVAKVVATRGDSGGVVLVVATKDRWSLRLNSEYNLVGNVLQLLGLYPTENNVLGLNQQAQLSFVLKLDTLWLGEGYQVPRVLGTDVSAYQTAIVMLNRATGQPEGSQGRVSVGRPLRNLLQPWGASVGGAWYVGRQRFFRGARVWQLPYTAADGSTQSVPYVYDRREATWSAVGTRSLGQEWKLNLTGGVGGYARGYRVPAGLTDEASTFLVDHSLPRSETASFLTGQASFFQARYAVLKDLATYQLSEDYQLGPSVLFVARWAERFLLSPLRFVELGLSARFTRLFADDFFRAQVSTRARFLSDQATWVNKRLAVEVQNGSPPLAGGRVFARALLDVRADDLNHGQLTLGGGNGLRGAPPDALAGPNELLLNLEYRARAVEMFSSWVAMVLFYDAGSAWTSRPRLVHTLGAGLRILLPQFNQEVIRLDLGFVIGDDRGFDASRFSSSFGQVDDFRPAFLDRPLD